MSTPVIEFNQVTKKYKLFRNEKLRIFSLFYDNKKHYKEKTASNKISFSINKGESIAVLGQNGAGKSTLLKIITGVVFPTSGTVEVRGRVSALLELKAGFDPEFTGRENLYLKAHLLGLTNDQIKNYEQSIIDFAELGEYIDQPVRTYSSGMKARLGFAINANIDPEILVIDEALSVGDAKFREKCRKKIDEIKQRDHVTVLYVTHSLDSAADFCERGLVLEGGKLIFDGEIHKAVSKYSKIISK